MDRYFIENQPFDLFTRNAEDSTLEIFLLGEDNYGPKRAVYHYSCKDTDFVSSTLGLEEEEITSVVRYMKKYGHSLLDNEKPKDKFSRIWNSVEE